MRTDGVRVSELVEVPPDALLLLPTESDIKVVDSHLVESFAGPDNFDPDSQLRSNVCNSGDFVCKFAKNKKIF